MPKKLKDRPDRPPMNVEYIIFIKVKLAQCYLLKFSLVRYAGNLLILFEFSLVNLKSNYVAVDALLNK